MLLNVPSPLIGAQKYERAEALKKTPLSEV
jgi:hypothetical protein